MKVLFQIKEQREVEDDSYNAEKGSTKMGYITVNEVDAEITQEMADKLKKAVHSLMAEEI